MPWGWGRVTQEGEEVGVGSKWFRLTNLQVAPHSLQRMPSDTPHRSVRVESRNFTIALCTRVLTSAAATITLTLDIYSSSAYLKPLSFKRTYLQYGRIVWSQYSLYYTREYLCYKLSWDSTPSTATPPHYQHQYVQSGLTGNEIIYLLCLHLHVNQWLTATSPRGSWVSFDCKISTAVGRNRECRLLWQPGLLARVPKSSSTHELIAGSVRRDGGVDMAKSLVPLHPPTVRVLEEQSQRDWNKSSTALSSHLRINLYVSPTNRGHISHYHGIP